MLNRIQKMLYLREGCLREGCLRAASRLISRNGQAHSFHARARAVICTSSIYFCNDRPHGISNKSQSFHQRKAVSFEEYHLKKNLPPARDAAFSPGPSSKSLASSTIAYAVISIGGVFVLYATASAHPHQLESWSAAAVDEEALDEINERYKPADTVTLREVDAIMAWDTESRTMNSGSSVIRYDSVRIPSNADGGEDRTVLVSGSLQEDLDWLMPCIFDGHVGSRTAVAVGKYLPHYVVRHMAEVSPHGYFSEADSDALDKAIKEAFIELDQDIFREAALALNSTEASAISALETVFAGSCAILSYYNVDQKLLKTACTGDSRTVLGRFSKTTGDWEAIPLSKDQTGRNESESLRLQREHPNEPEMIKNGRLLGLGVTRAFGDCRWKWPQELQEQARDKFCGPQIRDGLLTPPYLTAEPEITTVDIEPENGDFIIQASDGLWDELTSAQAVNLVGMWLQKHDPSKGAAPVLSEAEARALSALPEPETESSGRHVLYRNRVQEKDYIVKDENAASHLARNALGGRDETRLRGTSEKFLSGEFGGCIQVAVYFLDFFAP